MDGGWGVPSFKEPHNGPVESWHSANRLRSFFSLFLKNPLKLLKRYRPIALAIDIPPLELNIVNRGPGSMNHQDNALSLAANWHFVCGVCVPEEEVSNVRLTIVRL